MIMDSSRFLGICIVIAAVIVSAAVFYHERVGRYQFVSSADGTRTWLVDTTTGSFVSAPRSIQRN